MLPFPISTLDNSEIEEMTSKTVSVQLSKSEKLTLKGFQEEIPMLNSSITVLKDDLRTANDKLKLTEIQNAELQVKLLGEHSKLLLGPPGFNCWFSFAPVFQ